MKDIKNYKMNVCQNCGGDINAIEGGYVSDGTMKCPWCGHVFTVARDGASPGVREQLAIGEHDLDTCRFDDAYVAFSKAAELDGSEPEAFFGMALAAAKVQYLHDINVDTQQKRLQPICHEVGQKRFCDDANYAKALSLATADQRAIYTARAAEIDDIRKKFAELRSSGLEYDTFICVKVTDTETGRLTEDSHTADSIYHELKEQGYRPFYSEFEAKNRTGGDYEALILYALYTSKSMIVVCSNEDYLVTPWVKNEYTRFIEMIADDMKASDSLTIVFKDKPIEKLFGISGRIQGISSAKGDGYLRIIEFVARHSAAVRELARKEYSGTSYTKKNVIKQSVIKRTLGTMGGSAEITASDRSNLKLANDFLSEGSFDLAVRYAERLIASNPSNADAHWILFLSSCKLKSELEFRTARVHISSYTLFEHAISAAGSDAARFYDYLFDRVSNLKYAEDYKEYIELPGSAENDIRRLSDIMLSAAVQAADEALFDEAIKTVSDTDRYVSYNLKFAHKTNKLKYYQNILAADEGHRESLWKVFRGNNRLSNDTIVGFVSDPNHFSLMESELYAYGYNDYATDRLVDIAMADIPESAERACTVLDFALSMIPQENNQRFVEVCQNAVNALLFQGKRDAAARYNSRLLEVDKLDHHAHFVKCMLSCNATNPLALAKVDLLRNEEYLAAVDSYTEKFPSADNMYIAVAKQFAALERYTVDDDCFADAVESCYIPVEQLGSAGEMLEQFYYRRAKEMYETGLKKCGCADRAAVMRLSEDVSGYPEWHAALRYIMLCHGSDNLIAGLKSDLSEIVGNQAGASHAITEERAEEQRKIDAKEREHKRQTRAKLVFELLFILAALSPLFIHVHPGFALGVALVSMLTMYIMGKIIKRRYNMEKMTSANIFGRILCAAAILYGSFGPHRGTVYLEIYGVICVFLLLTGFGLANTVDGMEVSGFVTPFAVSSSWLACDMLFYGLGAKNPFVNIGVMIVALGYIIGIFFLAAFTLRELEL